MMAFHDTRDPNGDDTRTADLLRDAGPPPELPAEELKTLEGQVRAQWRELYAEQASPTPWWRSAPALAAAAVLVVAVALGSWAARRNPAEAPATPLLVVEAVSGTVTATRLDGGGDPRATPVALGDTVPLGAELRSLEGPENGTSVALRMPSGASFRLASGSHLTLAALDRLELASGAVYIDSPKGVTGAIAVHTPFGVAREIGTQFEVRLLDEGSAEASKRAVRVRVREGSVSLESEGTRRTVARGGELVTTEGGSWREGTIASDDSSWQWVIEAGPSFSTEGRTVAELIEWVGREAGWEVRYADADVVATAERVVYSGVFESLRPLDAVEVALPAALLEGEVQDGVLHVRRSNAQQ